MEEGRSSKLLVGIGNPGERYRFTRHNVGFLILDSLARDLGVEFKKKSDCKGLFARVKCLGVESILLKPSTYVNLSGESVLRVKKFLNIQNEDILVVVDDVNIPFGEVRLRCGAGSGGHNGIKSITALLGTNSYFQVKVGIGRPEGGDGLSDFVLGAFSLEEQEQLGGMFERAKEIIRSWIGSAAVENA